MHCEPKPLRCLYAHTRSLARPSVRQIIAHVLFLGARRADKVVDHRVGVRTLEDMPGHKSDGVSEAALSEQNLDEGTLLIVLFRETACSRLARPLLVGLCTSPAEVVLPCVLAQGGGRSMVRVGCDPPGHDRAAQPRVGYNPYSRVEWREIGVPNVALASAHKMNVVHGPECGKA